MKSFKGRRVLSKQSSVDWYSRGYFPHFDNDQATQHVCFHLFDSLPQRLVRQWREELARERAQGRLEEIDLQEGHRKRIHDSLDAGYGSCFLRNDGLAEIVEKALLHFDGERYELHAWCVMPNHVHTLFTPKSGHNMSAIVHTWKSFTAHECNRLLDRTGKFWAREPFDRYIRNARHFRNTAAYIENNPVKAGLCKVGKDWLWSSARRR
jgi:REP element-mobilizing transposase RayT